MEQLPNDNHWHLDKRLNIGHIGSTVMMIVGLMTWGSSVETRLSLGTQERQQQTKILQEIKLEQRSMNEKMDRFLEKVYGMRNK